MKLTYKIEHFLETGCAKKILASLLIGVIITGYATQYAKTVSADIADSVIRFHVLANSDSQQDQKLKLEVRDAVIEYLEDKLANAENAAQTKAILSGELENIKAVAQREIQSQGFDYKVDAVMGNFEFPTKVYGDTKFPAGRYDALRILIGEAEGQNWWCVLYPQLCFSKNDKGSLPEESRTKLKNVLTEDEYELITAEDDDIPVKIKFRIVELFKM